ncbi:hypothetical protein BH11BAC6_BH11BAC6_18200 [soil metagenome]
MNKIFLLVLLGMFNLLVPATNLNAQQNHFAYIQSDNNIPFDVSVNGKTYHSSSIGYVIVPKLTKGKYQFTISFPDKKYSNQQFNCNIEKNDEGFALKDYGDKGWGLYNLQSFDITMAGSNVAIDTTKETPKNNAFSDMLSQVVDDTTLNMKTEPIKPAETKKETDAIAIIVDSIATPATSNIPGLIKINQSSTEVGTDIFFLDNSNGMNDTIHIFYPVVIMDTVAVTVSAATTTLQDTLNPVKEETTVIKNVQSQDTTTVKAGGVANPFFDKNTATKTVPATDNNTVDTTKEVLSVTTAVREDCKNMLTENDMDKLRKKMVSAGGDDKMISVAKKYIDEKCLNTAQVKSLGALFLSDDGRYNFFNAIYGSVYDTAAFPSLENQLIDPNYKKNFRALIK